jgi:deoxyribodipyrimidine photo-lyase
MVKTDYQEVGGAPAARIQRANDHAVAPDRDFVLYWMIAARRTRWNFALDRAAAWARALDKPLIILEALRADYPWASDRLHRFVLDGMHDNEEALQKTPVAYYPYVEEIAGAGKGLLQTLSDRACIVLTDEFPCFFIPRMVAAAAEKIGAALEVVDGNGLLPLGATERDFCAAAHFRRYVQKELPRHLDWFPARRPFARSSSLRPCRIPREILRRWPRARKDLLAGDPKLLAALPIDHSIPAAPTHGGSCAAGKVLRRFITRGLATYHIRHNEPSPDATSRLSPYLHFGQISAHEVFDSVMRREHWSRHRLPGRATGAREGWWGVSPGAEAFLDQLIVWRELGYNTCAKRPDDYNRYESLPEWARQTLESHLHDVRSHVYTVRQLEEARTHDALWNAAQHQLRQEGWYPNYFRMLWGKKILEWSKSPRDALRIMIRIMDSWSLDGRDPNSYTGYFWTLGRYDRPWPERKIYGKVRSMSSERTAAKIDAAAYVRRIRALLGDREML